MLSKLFFYDRVKMLIILSDENETMSDLIKKAGFTWTNGFKILKEMEKFGLIKLEDRDGRSYTVLLTEEGRELAEDLKNILKKLKEMEVGKCVNTMNTMK
ncbi:MAG: winged helix-turn-helix domain-containing protein [Candidatus Aenigmatarchaeota archaeon]